MLTTKHYVPILKWKRAEQGALKDLREDQKLFMMPIIEVVMPKPKDDSSASYNAVIAAFKDVRTLDIPKEILQAWGEDPIFVDLSLVYPSDLKLIGMEQIISNSRRLRLNPVPVLNLSDDKDYKDLVASISGKFNTGICLRVTSFDLKDVITLDSKLRQFLKDYNLEANAIDILVDLKDINEFEAYKTAVVQSQKISNLKDWKSFIFADGSFPQDLSNCRKDDYNLVSRNDWKNWKRQVDTNGMTRVPTYADYTVRHPIYNESLQVFHPTASIKYTFNDNWLVLKGQKLRFDQYLGNANLLINSSKKEYYGEEFSAGDKFIFDKGNYYKEYELKKRQDPTKTKGTGSTEQWIRASINHHLSVVVDQLANQA